MKGQFLLISSVVIGLMMISLGSTVAEIQSREYDTEDSSYYTKIIQDEAEKIQDGGINQDERREFREMLGMISEYNTDSDYWRQEDCFNITMEKPGTRLEFHAPQNC